MPELPVIVEHIDSGLEELLDRFFELSRVDLDQMQAAVDNGDFETLVRLGHTAKGTGHGYGFHGMGDIGGAIEQAALGRDLEAVNSHVDRMRHYLENVQIKFIE